MQIVDGYMNIFQIAPNMTDLAWRRGASNLEKACERSNGEITGSQLKMQIGRGEVTLLVIEDEGNPAAWLAVEIQVLPNFRCLFVHAIYAPGATVAESFDLLRQYAAANGASRIRGACGDAVSRLWERKYGFRQAHRIMEIEI